MFSLLRLTVEKSLFVRSINVTILSRPKISRAKCFVRSYASDPNEGLKAMALSCENCQGAAVPAAQMRTFEFEGQPLHCLAFVSSCIVCGLRWEDERYEAANSHHAERARAVATIRQQPPHETHMDFVPIKQSATVWQSR